jgi:hypothetical protein
MQPSNNTYRSFLSGGAAGLLLPAAIGLLALTGACKESYVPPVVSTSNSYLVVEGFINNGPDTTRISITHTFKLDDSASVVPELGATVSVEGKGGGSFPLTESGNGLYFAPGLSLNQARQYRLHIITSGGKNYASDYVDLRVSPPIDSVNWINSPSGFQIYLNTHDPQNASRYYRWEFNETWQFHSVYYSYYMYNPADTTVTVRINPDKIYTCWQSHASTNVFIGSSAKLAQDVIYQYPLVNIAPNSWKISVLYSILVKQYALTPDAYDFWQQLQKNSEEIGSVFSPQPSEAKGNIHNLADSTEQVIGYISAGTMQQKRIFVSPYQIPGWAIGSYTDGCQLWTTPRQTDSILEYFGGQNFIPVDEFLGPGGQFRVFYSTQYCTDCRLTGYNVKPSFWP